MEKRFLFCFCSFFNPIIFVGSICVHDIEVGVFCNPCSSLYDPDCPCNNPSWTRDKERCCSYGHQSRFRQGLIHIHISFLRICFNKFLGVCITSIRLNSSHNYSYSYHSSSNKLHSLRIHTKESFYGLYLLARRS